MINRRLARRGIFILFVGRVDLIKWNLITEEGEGKRSYKNLTRFFHGRFTSPILSVLIGWTNIRGGCVDPDYLVQWCFHGERGASKIKRTGADYFKNKFSRSRILLSKSRGGGGEKENETHKKCIILRKNGQEKVISKRNCLPSKILWYFFFLQFNEMRILLSKSRKKNKNEMHYFKKKRKILN